MALPSISVKVTADTASAEAGLDRVESSLDDLGSSAARAQSKVNKLDAPIKKVATSSGRMRSAVQNASFQLSDMAVMMEMGVAPSRVMAQQLPQLVAGFGAFGAALGAVIAIGIPLATTMGSMAENGQNVYSVFGTLEPIMRSLAGSMETVRDLAIDFGELVVNNLDRIIITAGVAATLFAGRFVAGFVAARIATMSLSASLVALRAALIRTGIGALIVGAGELVYQFTRLMSAAGGLGNALGLLGDVAKEVFDRILLQFKIIPNGIAAGATYMAAFFVGKLADMASNFTEFTWTVAEGLNNLFGTNLRGGSFGPANAMQFMASDLEAAASDFASRAGAAMVETAQPLESLQKIKDLMSSMKDEGLTLGGILGVDEGEDGGGKSLSEKLDEQAKRIKEHLDTIKNLTIGTLSDKLGAWSSYFNDLASLTGSNNEKLLAIAKSFGAAQALIDAWRAHNAVLADPTLPWWARIASAAKVLASGIGAVNAIKSVGSNGSGTTSASSSSTSTTTAESASAANVNIALTGTLDTSQLQSLTEQLNAEYEDGYRLNFV